MSTGLIPSKVDTCTLNIYVSEVDCSPSKYLANQISAEHTAFDKARLAAGGYTLLTVQYTSEEQISGFQFELDMPKHHSRIVAVGTKIGNESSQSSEASDKNFLVFNSSNSVIGIVNPEVNGSITSPSKNLSAQANDTNLCYVLLEKSKSYTSNKLCPEEVQIKNVKACRNINTSNASILSAPKPNWKGKVSSKTGLSDVYLASKLFASKTYDIKLDANNDGVIDIVDIVTIANKRHNVLFDKSNNNVTPEYICQDHKEFITKADLNADLSISSVIIQANKEDSTLYDLHVEFGLRSSNTTAGFQIDFGKDTFNSSKLSEKIEMIGPLKPLEDNWAYKFETVRNRFDRDSVTRLMVYQLPIDVNNVQLKNNLSSMEEVLSVNSLPVMPELTPVIRYSVIGCDLSEELNPEPQYYYADELSPSTRDKQEIKYANKKGERYYGVVNQKDKEFYTGKVFNPDKSRRLTQKWDCFATFNERVVTNDFVSYFEHDSQNIKYSGFDLAYDVDAVLLKEHFENDLTSYFKYLVNYLYITPHLRNGLSSKFSAYTYEPSSSTNTAHNGYISDANLNGRKDISDTISLVNIATQKLSSTKSSTLKILQNLSKNESTLSDQETSNSSVDTTVCDDEVETRYNLKSLTKIVPTYVLENFTTTTFPHFKPSLNDQNIDAAIIHFSGKKDISGSNHPPEFKNWSEYFNDIHNIEYWELPEKNEFSFANVNLATNSSKVSFIKSAEFILDFSNAYSSMTNKKLWVYPGNGFSSGSYTLTVRQDSSSGSEIENTDALIGSSGKIHIKLDIVDDSILATSITHDGGPLNLVKLFFTTVPDYISGKYVDFSTTPNHGVIESVGKPLDRTSSTNYLQYNTSNRLIYGPKLSYLNEVYKDNSSSKQVYGDTVLRLRAVGPSEIDVEYDTIKPFNSASFELRAIDGVEPTVDTTQYLPSQAGFTTNIVNPIVGDGITTVELTAAAGTMISGSGELMRLKLDRRLFPNEVLESGKEIMSPPKGETGDLIVPNVVKTSVFPQISNLVFHIDASNSYWYDTTSSGSQQLLSNLSNPYGIVNLSQSSTASMPLVTMTASSFIENVNYFSFNSTGSLQVLSSSITNPDTKEVDLEKFTLVGVINPLSFEGDWNKVLFKASSSANTIKISLKGKTTVPSEGSITLTTSGSTGGVRELDMKFSSTNYVGQDGHIFIITSDGSDSSNKASNMYLNGTLITSSFSSLSSSGAQKVKYMIGGEGTNHENFYYGNVGEFILFNDVVSSDVREVFEGYTAYKWGTNSKLPSNHKYYSARPSTANTTINNSATTAAINKSEDYFPGSGSSSDRSSARIFSSYAGLSSVSIVSGSSQFTNPSYNDLRDLPKQLNNTSSISTDTEIFINSYDKKTGLLEIGYSSVKNIDGFWLQLGNSVSGSSGLKPKQVGIIDKDKKDRTSECFKRRWSQYFGYGPNDVAIYKKDPRKVKALKNIAFGFAQGLVGKSKKIPKDYYRNSGSWCIPPTPKGETGVLTKLRVDPSSYRGVPTIKSYKLVTNDSPQTPAGTWTGDSSGGIVGFDDLSTVIKYAQYGFYNSNSTISAIASEAVKYDSEGDASNLDIVDVLSVFNHLVLSGGAGATNTALNIVPQNCNSSLVTAPGSITVTATASPCQSGSAVTLSWVTGSGGTPSGYEIWRRGSVDSTNKKDRSYEFQFKNDPDVLYRKTSRQYEKIKTINKSTVTSFLDKEPPYNDNCCEDSDNPKIDYLVIAFNSGGESTGNSNTVRLSCCNEVPVARNVSLTSSINNSVTFTADVTENNAAPPFGTASASEVDPEVLSFKIIDYGNGTLNNLKNNDGIFTFKPDRDFLGNTSITYQVSNEAGCSAQAKVNIMFTPSNFEIQGKVMKNLVNNSVNYPVLIQWDREDVRGNILKYELFRALAGSSYSSEPTATISGKLPVTERYVTYYDSVAPAATDTNYKYKVKAWGFQGDASKAIADNKFSFVETDDLYLTIPSRITGSNPVVTVSASNYLDADHPIVKLSWSKVVANSKDVQYYKVYRFLDGDEKYLKQNLVKYDGNSSYVWYDRTLPTPDKLTKYGTEDYVASYRVTSVSDDGENGNPNKNWSGNTYTASISGSAMSPTAKDKTLSVCHGETLTGTVSDLIYNNVSTSTSYSASALSGLSFNTSNGTFTYSNSTAGNYSFVYSATSGTKVSNNGTITIRVLDCTDLAVPDGMEESHIITDNYTMQGQVSKTVDQVPFGLKEKGGQNIRNSSKPYAVSKGEIDTSEE